MKRRAFLGLFVAATVAPFVPAVARAMRPPAVGGIEHSTYVWWRNAQFDGACPPLTYDLLEESFRKMYARCEARPRYWEKVRYAASV